MTERFYQTFKMTLNGAEVEVEVRASGDKDAAASAHRTVAGSVLNAMQGHGTAAAGKVLKLDRMFAAGVVVSSEGAPFGDSVCGYASAKVNGSINSTIKTIRFDSRYNNELTSGEGDSDAPELHPLLKNFVKAHSAERIPDMNEFGIARLEKIRSSVLRGIASLRKEERKPDGTGQQNPQEQA